ncbi:MAG TPA: LamG domain-containing protein [Kofleriaceae bacterium]|nr:LamG domain-containing protein [Kofleriaceae bacterium]
MRAVLVLVLASGCGRYGFHPFGDDEPIDGPAQDTAPADVAPDSAFQDLVNDPHLVGYWKMDDAMYLDSSASGNAASGCYQACPMLGTGIRGMAADFHNDGGLEVGTVAPLSSLSTNLTVAAWVNLRSLTDYGAIVSTDRDCCLTQNGFSLWASRYQMYPHFDMWNQGQFFCGGTNPPPLNTWIFYAATYDNQEGRFYIDGAEYDNIFVTNAIGTPHSFPLRIGHMGFDYIGGLDGLVDEVMIFDRALTAVEIQTIYTELKP